ncbi:MAG: M12 family metallo-peptidase, partial [Saprospiraceae bacterium]|nr:M12 family metallo-peptidase [Saprospiraceae bacterium]
MSHCLRLLYLALAMVGVFTLPCTLQGQIFNGQPQEVLSPELQNQLRHWQVYQMDAAALYNFVKTNPSATPAQLNLGQHHWQLSLQPNPILGPNYTVQTLGSRGLETIKPVAPKAFRGNELAGGGTVRLTLDQDFIYGFVEEGGERFYIEPLWYYLPTADRNLFIVYAAKDVNRDLDATCAMVESERSLQRLQNTEPTRVNGEIEFLACYETELAIASDRSMFLKYGSVAGVENHNIGVINNTEGDYSSGAFNHSINFIIVTQFVSTGSDPWTNSTNAGNLLDSFVAWGNSGGFGDTYDLGELWTDRDFDGGTVGIAYVGAVCTSVRYHCLQDFTAN